MRETDVGRCTSLFSDQWCYPLVRSRFLSWLIAPVNPMVKAITLIMIKDLAGLITTLSGNTLTATHAHNNFWDIKGRAHIISSPRLGSLHSPNFIVGANTRAGQRIIEILRSSRRPVDLRTLASIALLVRAMIGFVWDRHSTSLMRRLSPSSQDAT